MTVENKRGLVPRVPLNVRMGRHRGRYLAAGYEFVLELSDTAVFVWGQIDGTTDVDGIVTSVSREYSIDVGTAAEDVRALLDELADHRLIVWDVPAASAGPAAPVEPA
jgi:Coenzyme PQQ synthesis protein D (PqqD)